MVQLYLNMRFTVGANVIVIINEVYRAKCLRIHPVLSDQRPVTPSMDMVPPTLPSMIIIFHHHQDEPLKVFMGISHQHLIVLLLKIDRYHKIILTRTAAANVHYPTKYQRQRLYRLHYRPILQATKQPSHPRSSHRPQPVQTIAVLLPRRCQHRMYIHMLHLPYRRVP